VDAGAGQIWRAARVFHQNSERAAVQQEGTPDVPSNSFDRTICKDASYEVALNRHRLFDGDGVEHRPDRIRGRGRGRRPCRHHLRSGGGGER